jgi:hypothetical protein|tara:strand:- start:195 stop:452 length:258 start_codon:yes stop_codon:yes gene_type:complete
MTTEKQDNIEILLDITKTLREGVKDNHNFSMTISDTIKEVVSFVTRLEQRVQLIEKNRILNGDFIELAKLVSELNIRLKKLENDK